MVELSSGLVKLLFIKVPLPMLMTMFYCVNALNAVINAIDEIVAMTPTNERSLIMHHV